MSSVRMKQVLFDHCFWLHKTLNSYKNSRMKLLMQWKYQTVKLNNSSLPPAFCTQDLRHLEMQTHHTHINLHTGHSARAVPSENQPNAVRKEVKGLAQSWCHLSWKDVKGGMKSPLLQGLSDTIYTFHLENSERICWGGGEKKGQGLVTAAFQKEGVSPVTLLSKCEVSYKNVQIEVRGGMTLEQTGSRPTSLCQMRSCNTWLLSQSTS